MYATTPKLNHQSLSQSSFSFAAVDDALPVAALVLEVGLGFMAAVPMALDREAFLR